MSGEFAGALADQGIQLRHHQHGEQRTPCPECDRGPRDDALAVRIDRDGATWFCHRCGFKGGFGPARSEWAAKPRHEHRQPESGRCETLAAWGLHLWEACKPIETGTIAAAYLEGRRCALPPFPDETHLRWHPTLLDRVSDYRGPVLVALVTDVGTAEPINLHRTWLKADGTGKAPIGKPRRLLKGHRSRGVIRLWPDDELTLGLVLGEGIETCLAAARAGLTPVWSTMTAGNLAAFPVLPGIEGITVLVDHDRPNPQNGRRAGHQAAQTMIARYVAAGFDPKRDIRVILPPEEGEDAADLEVPE